jgi:hypothetical protein
VASRSPSRSRQRPVLPLDGLVAGPEVSNVPIGSNNENIAYSGESEVRDSNDGVETPDKLEWTMVRRRHSLGSFRENEKRPLTSEQKKVVSMAKDSLTAEQKQKIQLQQKKVRKRDNSSSSRGEGPSEPKRKAKDPQEWGNVDFSRENLGMEAQATALEFFKRKLKDQKHLKKKTHRKRRSRSTNRDTSQQREKDGKKTAKGFSNRGERPAESQPSAQIAPKAT